LCEALDSIPNVTKNYLNEVFLLLFLLLSSSPPPHYYYYYLLLLYYFAVLGIKAKPSHMASKDSTAQLHFQLFIDIINCTKVML
jgi:hypothetical protein